MKLIKLQINTKLESYPIIIGSNIVKNLKGTTYLSGPSGKDYLDKSYFKNIKINFFEPKVENYYSTLYNI